jgi:hypothetical protein
VEGRGNAEKPRAKPRAPLAPPARCACAECEGSDRGRRKQAHEAGDADRRGSAMVVGEHTEGDEVRPLGRNRRAPGQLGTAYVRILSRDAKGGGRLADSRHGGSQPQGGSSTSRCVELLSIALTLTAGRAPSTSTCILISARPVDRRRFETPERHATCETSS